MRIGIIGQGRIGRCVARHLGASEHHLVAVQEPGLDPLSWAYLMRHDSVHRTPPFEVRPCDEPLGVNLGAKRCWVLPDPYVLPSQWAQFEVDLLVDCSGREELLPRSQEALPPGTRHYLVTRACSRADQTWIEGVSSDGAALRNAHVVSTGSCTANAVGPVLRVLLDRGLPMVGGTITILHPYLSVQNLLDNPGPRDDRSTWQAAPSTVSVGRSALGGSLVGIVGAMAEAFDVRCYRVPLPAGLTIDLCLDFSKRVDGHTLRDALCAAEASTHRGLIHVDEDPICSVDAVDTTWSAIIAGAELPTSRSRRHRLTLWQDNEWAYSRRVVDTIDRLAR